MQNEKVKRNRCNLLCSWWALRDFYPWLKDSQNSLQPAWMERYKGRQDVLLLDWSTLSFFHQKKSDPVIPRSNFTEKTKKALGSDLGDVSNTLPAFMETYQNYIDAAHNSVDVGSYVGRCLAGLTRSKKFDTTQ